MQGQVDFAGSGAILSDCEGYRYRLDRHVGAGDTIYAFFGVNPSTADHTLNDATVRKWIGFSSRLGASRFMVGNAFAARSKNVGDLRWHSEPIGPDWRVHIDNMISEADVLVPCWGARAKIPKPLRIQFDYLGSILEESAKPKKCWGLTGSGDPYHPLMLAYSTPLVDWSR